MSDGHDRTHASPRFSASGSCSFSSRGRFSYRRTSASTATTGPARSTMRAPGRLRTRGRRHALNATATSAICAVAGSVRRRVDRVGRSRAAGEPDRAPNYTMSDHWWAMVIDVETCIGCGTVCVPASSKRTLPPDRRLITTASMDRCADGNRSGLHVSERDGASVGHADRALSVHHRTGRRRVHSRLPRTRLQTCTW